MDDDARPAADAEQQVSYDKVLINRAFRRSGARGGAGCGWQSETGRRGGRAAPCTAAHCRALLLCDPPPPTGGTATAATYGAQHATFNHHHHHNHNNPTNTHSFKSLPPEAAAP